ncbi:MAG: hypothetical protein KIS62_14340 [Ramlibacter sp.]|nr:hypothetical protein [Ramlibacter sp.]
MTAVAASLPPAAIWRQERLRLMAGLGAVLVAAAAGYWVQQRKDDALQRQQLAQTQLQQATRELAEAEEARTRLEANLRQFEELKRSGFIGEPDRVGLIEALEFAARAMSGAAVRWQLNPAQSIEAITDPRAGAPVAEVREISMTLTAEDTHEQEWLALLGNLRQSARGQARVQGCDWSTAQLSGAFGRIPAVRANCEVRWIYLLAPQSPAPQGQ